MHQIKVTRPEAGKRIEEMLSRPTHLLSTILIGNTLVNVCAAALGYVIAESCWPSHGEAISVPALTLLLLVFGEVSPKRIAMARPKRLAEAYSVVLPVLIRIMMPIRMVLQKISGLLKEELAVKGHTLTEDEFRTVVEVGEEEGVVDEEERGMVDGIIMLEETQVSEVMTPRVDLIGIDLEDPPDKQEDTAKEARFRYLPVYRGSLDNVEGLLDVPKFLLSESHDRNAALIHPYCVPETAPLDSLLGVFQRENRRVALVVDEFGGTAGLITRGDILEEIVTDVESEYGEEKLTIEQIGQNAWLVEGSTSLEDVNYELDLNLEADGADRLAGWVSAKAEHLPRSGEVVEAQGCRATVQRIRKHRIVLVRLEKLKEFTEESEEVA